MFLCRLYSAAFRLPTRSKLLMPGQPCETTVRQRYEESGQVVFAGVTRSFDFVTWGLNLVFLVSS